RRPQEMAALLATLDAKLDAARRLRLARDNRIARAAVLAKYRRAVAEPLAIMQRDRLAIDQIRRLAGPSPARLTSLANELATASRFVEPAAVPAEVAEAHDTLKTAVQLAMRAVEERRHAVETNDMGPAKDASSAAAGALMLFDRAAKDIKTLTS